MEKDQNTLKDKVLEDGAGGVGQTNGWVCENCHNAVTAAKGWKGKVYCIPCFQSLFPDEPVV